ncbi:MAG: terpene cyclase/mutase family protein [Myxococcales bacterium]|nr:terpene cyclase/mutase family protein [Myxococcales bacterium]
MRAFCGRQRADGHWAGDYGGPLFLLPGFAIACHVTGVELSDYQRRRMIAYLEHVQNHDGGWGLHIESPSYVFGTTLNYVALRLLGVGPDDTRAARARAWLLAHGGAAGVPNWGKFWLAVLGVYSWDGVLPVPPELWLMPRSVPLHPANYWCHTRAIYLPVSYLYGRRARGPESQLLGALRQEIFCERVDEIRWSALREQVAPGDVYTPHSTLLRFAGRALAQYDRVHVRALRRRALAAVLDHIRHEDESTNYLDIGPVSKPLNMLAIWFAEGDSPRFRRHVERLGDYLWDAEDGMKVQGYNGSQLWDTAFTAQAILESGMADELDATLQRAHAFIDANQVRENVPDHARYFRDATIGAWPFSTAEQAWPVSDCTAEALKVSLLLAPRVESPLSDARLRQAADFLLSQQNDDGGWSEYERRRGPAWLELFNAAELFGDIMIAQTYVECTAAAVKGLSAFSRHDPRYRRGAVQDAIARGARCIRALQRDDGSFYGSWGVCFTYGTWFGIEGLLAAGASRHDDAIRRAVAFLRATQRDDGGWGESYRSCTELRYVQHERAQVVNTAWAMLALMAAGCTSREVLEPAARLLASRQRADGTWAQEAISGVFNKACMINYDNYRNIFPLWALARYHRVMETSAH